MPTSSYDIVALGDDFAGLVAATLCASRGLRVLLLVDQERPVSYQLGPFTLPVEPLPIFGLESPAIARVVDELNFVHLLKRKMRAIEPPFQFVTDGARLDVRTDAEALAGELRRELGESGAGVANSACDQAESIADVLGELLSEEVTIPPSGFWEKREVGKASEKLDAAHIDHNGDSGASVKALVEIPGALSSNVWPDELSPTAIGRAFSLWRRGIGRLPGDWASLREFFLDKFQSHNGEMRRAEVERLTFSWGKVNGVRLESGEEIAASHVIGALPLADLVELADKKAPKRLKDLAASVAPAGYRYTLNVVVDEAGIPAGMGQNVIAVADVDGPLWGDNALAIYVDEPDDRARRVVTIEALCPASPGDDIDDLFADLRVKIRERLELVMPFVSEHIIVAHSPNESAPAEGLGERLELAEPASPRPLWHTELEHVAGIPALPYNVGLKNLTVASSQVLPSLGWEGQWLAGWSAAKLACGHIGKKGPIKEELLD